MRKLINRRGENLPFFTIVIVDSRSGEFPLWVKKALFSLDYQTLENFETIIIENLGKHSSIGKCFNEGLKAASAEWVFFLGDDDYLSFDYLASLKSYIDNFTDEDTVIATTNSTFFSDDGKEVKAFEKMAMGAYRRSYFINHLFDESLKKYVDVTAMKYALMDGKEVKCCQWHYGYFYRQHYNNISGRKTITKKEHIKYEVDGLEKDFYIVDPNGTTNEIKKHFNAVRSKIFIPELAMKSKVILCTWDHVASDVANWGGSQTKIIILDRSRKIDLDFNKFDHVIISRNANKIIKKIDKILGVYNDSNGNVSKVENLT